MPPKPAQGVAAQLHLGIQGRHAGCGTYILDGLKRLRHRVIAERRGASSLEFALICGPLMALVLGTIELSRYLITLTSVRTVAAEAARTATLRGSQNMNAGSSPCTNLGGTLAVAGARTPFLNPASLTVTMGGCATNAGVTTVTITVTYPFAFTLPYFGNSNRPITETVQGIFN
jgi:Flp pilus assembly protein TadG